MSGLHSHPSANRFLTVQQAAFWRKMHEELAQTVLGPGGNRSAVDVGCGPGLLCRILKSWGWSPLGVDSSAEMLEAAAVVDSSDSIEYATADILRLASDLAPRKFDLAVSTNLIFFLDDPLAAILQMAHCVRAGGRVVMMNPLPRLTPDYAKQVARQEHMSEVEAEVLVHWALYCQRNRSFDIQLAQAIYQMAGLTNISTSLCGPAGVGLVITGTVVGPS